MEDAIKQFYNDLKKTRKKCPWAKKQTILDHIDELEKEIEEVKHAIKKNDNKNLEEELGDVFMDALFLLVIAEEKGFDAKKIIKSVNGKIVRRKPWVFGDMKIKTVADAIKVWNKIKEEEKKEKAKKEKISRGA